MSVGNISAAGSNTACTFDRTFKHHITNNLCVCLPCLHSLNQVLEVVKDGCLGVASVQMRTTLTLINGQKVSHRKSGTQLYLDVMPSDLQTAVRAALASDESVTAAAAAAGEGPDDDEDAEEEQHGDQHVTNGAVGGGSSSARS